MENKDSQDKLNNTQQEQEHNPNSSINLVVEEQQQEEERNGSDVDQPPQSPRQPSSSSSTTTTTRTPFTNLSQVDADLALARTLQEQERAYMMLRINNEGSDYGSWEAGSYVLDDDDDDEDEDEDDEDEDFNDPHDETDDERIDGADDNDEDAFDVHAHAHGNDDLAGEENNPSIEFDPAIFSSDEAYARALQDAEDRDMAARLLALAGINDLEADEDEDIEDHGGNSQDTWEEVDPDELSYEELLALGDVVGTESRGLSADIIASLPSINYKSGSSQNGSSNDSCVICRLDYEDGETLTVLSCKHSYHPECINNWLNINKVCPVCSAEVSVCGNS
ncbi:hypothetical protein ACJW30_03G105600 [Castanea mollissima]